MFNCLPTATVEAERLVQRLILNSYQLMWVGLQVMSRL